MDYRKAVQRAIMSEIAASRPVSYRQSAGFCDQDGGLGGAFKRTAAPKGKEVSLKGMNALERRDYIVKDLLRTYKGSRIIKKGVHSVGGSALGSKEDAMNFLEILYDPLQSAKQNYRILSALVAAFGKKKNDEYKDYTKSIEQLVGAAMRREGIDPSRYKQGRSQSDFEAAIASLTPAQRRVRKAAATRASKSRATKPVIKLFPLDFRKVDPTSTSTVLDWVRNEALNDRRNEAFSPDQIDRAVSEKYQIKGRKGEYKLDGYGDPYLKKKYNLRFEKLLDLAESDPEGYARA